MFCFNVVFIFRNQLWHTQLVTCTISMIMNQSQQKFIVIGMCRLGLHVADDFTHSISVQQLPFQISDTLCCVPYCVCFYTLLYTKKHKHTTLKSLQAVVIVLLCEKYKKFAKHEHVSSHLVKNTQLAFLQACNS